MRQRSNGGRIIVVVGVDKIPNGGIRDSEVRLGRYGGLSVVRVVAVDGWPRAEGGGTGGFDLALGEVGTGGAKGGGGVEGYRAVLLGAGRWICCI